MHGGRSAGRSFATCSGVLVLVLVVVAITFITVIVVLEFRLASSGLESVALPQAKMEHCPKPKSAGQNLQYRCSGVQEHCPVPKSAGQNPQAKICSTGVQELRNIAPSQNLQAKIRRPKSAVQVLRCSGALPGSSPPFQPREACASARASTAPGSRCRDGFCIGPTTSSRSPCASRAPMPAECWPPSPSSAPSPTSASSFRRRWIPSARPACLDKGPLHRRQAQQPSSRARCHAQIIMSAGCRLGWRWTAPTPKPCCLTSAVSASSPACARSSRPPWTTSTRPSSRDRPRPLLLRQERWLGAGLPPWCGTPRRSGLPWQPTLAGGARTSCALHWPEAVRPARPRAEVQVFRRRYLRISSRRRRLLQARRASPRQGEARLLFGRPRRRSGTSRHPPPFGPQLDYALRAPRELPVAAIGRPPAAISLQPEHRRRTSSSAERRTRPGGGPFRWLRPGKAFESRWRWRGRS